MARAIPTICVSFKNDENNQKMLINKCDYNSKIHKIEKRTLILNDETEKQNLSKDNSSDEENKENENPLDENEDPPNFVED